MSTHKNIDRICVIAVVFALLLSAALMNGEALGIQVQAKQMGYESRLFDTSRVHTIDIVMGDWAAFLQTCQSEEYSVCDVVIDGETFKNVGIRGKGNTSLSTVSSMNSDRYSFKIEFDQYDSTKNYYGLDKLSLNNLIQDNTMMKDYLTYQLMGQFCVASPLCSYVYITVNGESWGLYLAVEAVEHSFLQRNYGKDYGELYKPDSMDMGGGRGNGRNFSFDDATTSTDSYASASAATAAVPGGRGQWNQMTDGQTLTDFNEETQGSPRPEDFDVSRFGDGMGGEIDSRDVKLQYAGEDAGNYANIFDNAKTDVTEADQLRLVEALSVLSGEYAASVIDVESVIRYFVVHNFVVNADSYTGSMVHNYYLYEENGKLSMIPWDYNLAFGTFQGNDASSAVNDNIDAPLSVTGSGDRPMIDWIYANEEYTRLYHRYFQEFLRNVDVNAIIDRTAGMIAPYVEAAPNKFCTYDAFETGVQTLKTFCRLRIESVSAQLNGEEGTVDASSISLSDMGTMNQTMGGMGQMIPDGINFPGMVQGTDGENMQMPFPQSFEDAQLAQMPSGIESDHQFPDSMQQMGGGSGQIPGGNGTGQESFENKMPASTQNGSQWILLGVAFVFLAAGLVFAFKFKR